MINLMEQIKYSAQLRWNRVHKFQAKINLYLEVGSYIIKTAESKKELLESFRLRDEVFNQEFRGLQGAGLDFDKYDYHFDHLIIVHKESRKIIGTYRLNCSKFSTESYTGLEFNLDFLRTFDGTHLELGRACIHKDYRKGAVISLLWRGIAEYMNICDAQLLFGCSSLKINNAREAALVFKYLQDNGHVTTKVKSYPTKKFLMKDYHAWTNYFALNINDTQKKEAESLVPSLLKSYLKLGAKVASIPAFDEDFDCIDLLTVLKKEDLADSLATKLKVVR